MNAHTTMILQEDEDKTPRNKKMIIKKSRLSSDLIRLQLAGL